MESIIEGSKGTITKTELERELNKIANKAVMFVNFSDEIFSGTPYIGKDGKECVDEHCKWDGSPFRFEPGEVQYLPEFQFRRLQKHLVDREMNRAGVPTNNHLRKDYETKCSVPVVREEVAKVVALAAKEAEKINQETDRDKEIAEAKGEISKKKVGRPRKVKVLEEESFEGLKDESTVA